MHLEMRKAAAEELRETGQDVSALSQDPLEWRRDRGHDESVEPHARHQHELPAIDLSKADRPRVPQHNRAGDLGRSRTEADFGCQDVGRSHRNERDWRRVRRETVDDFVHGAIATRHHDPIVFSAGGPRRHCLRIAAACRLMHRDTARHLLQVRDHVAQRAAPPPGGGIVDDKDTAGAHLRRTRRAVGTLGIGIWKVDGSFLRKLAPAASRQR